ncbi:MAG TPA: DUF3558 family protein [Candidatus Limnocylindrales bacterium]
MRLLPLPRSTPSLLPAAFLAISLAACGTVATPSAGSGSSVSGTASATPGPIDGGATTPPGTPSPTGAGRVLDPCALLTDDEITKTTGFSPISREAVGGDGALTPGCTWELDSGTPGLTWSISLDVVSPGGQQYYDTFVTIDETLKPVPELGASAGINEFGIVNAVDADTLITLYYIQMPRPKADPTIPLAKLVLEHVRQAPMS